MRTNKELLILMLANIHKLEFGLCYLAYQLYDADIITIRELKKLHLYIDIHRPGYRSKLSDKTRLFTSYFWEAGLKPPRERWLKYHVRICKN